VFLSFGGCRACCRAEAESSFFKALYQLCIALEKIIREFGVSALATYFNGDFALTF
jgi:hypothetical protein